MPCFSPCMHMYMHIHVHSTCLSPCMHTYIHEQSMYSRNAWLQPIYAYIHLCIRTCAHDSSCLSPCIHTCTHICMHTYTNKACILEMKSPYLSPCMHAYIHTYTPTHMNRFTVTFWATECTRTRCLSPQIRTLAPRPLLSSSQKHT
jgi:hypothetical protein